MSSLAEPKETETEKENIYGTQMSREEHVQQ